MVSGVMHLSSWTQSAKTDSPQASQPWPLHWSLTSLTGTLHGLQDPTLDNASKPRAEWETHIVDCKGRRLLQSHRARLAQDSRTPARRSGLPRRSPKTSAAHVAFCGHSVYAGITERLDLPFSLGALSFSLSHTISSRSKEYRLPMPRNLPIIRGAEAWAS